MPEKVKVNCCVDGFNLYHAIKELGRPELKWVNLWELARQFVDPTTEVLNRVVYFSAIAHFRTKGSVDRHKSFIAANKSYGVQVSLGKFKKKTLRCKKCGQVYGSHEEKMSDINIAIHMVGAALTDVSRILLISGDSDFASTIRVIRGLGGYSTQVRVIGPPGRYPSYELAAAAGRKVTIIKTIHLERCQLPDRVVCADGSVVTRPPEWT